jgi:hypothetical protein
VVTFVRWSPSEQSRGLIHTLRIRSIFDLRFAFARWYLEGVVTGTSACCVVEGVSNLIAKACIPKTNHSTPSYNFCINRVESPVVNGTPCSLEIAEAILLSLE